MAGNQEFVSKLNQDKMPVVVIDKSFAQGTRFEALQELADAHIVVVTSGFYFETFTTLSESRKRVFAGFPEFRRVDSSRLYQHERDTRTPANSLDAVRLNVNSDVISGNRILSADEEQCVENYNTHVVQPEIEFWKGVIDEGVLGFDASEVSSVIGDQPAFESLCTRILNVEFIRSVATKLSIPHGELLDSNWFTFRSLQAKLLHGLTLRYTYPHQSSRRSDEDLEHDVHGIDYLTVGLHAQCFATNESKQDFRKLGWKFKFLCPKGCLLQSESNQGRSQILMS